MSQFMQAAIEEAQRGLHEGRIPIGSVLVKDGQDPQEDDGTVLRTSERILTVSRQNRCSGNLFLLWIIVYFDQNRV